MAHLNSDPIGVFDSGIGGLTVVKTIMAKLPHENIIYFGDIARLPYGTKSVTTIRKFAAQTVKFLISQKVKAIVIACNTISAVAKDEVKNLAKNIPVIDVISSGSKASAFSSKNNKIGVIATPATINSDAYPTAIQKLNPKVQVFSQACSLFVPLIEEGFIDHVALELIAREYLQPLIRQQIDTLILGCTHYPLIKEVIAKIMGIHTNLIDPAISTSEELVQTLSMMKMFNLDNIAPDYRFFVTEIVPKFQSIGERFLKTQINHLELVTLD